MSKHRLIFYAVFVLFHLVIVIFTLHADSQKENLQYLIRMQGNIHLFKYGAFLGLILMIADIAWSFLVGRNAASEKKELNLEINNLKAKIFDLQEGNKTKTSTEASNKPDASQ
ncbi:MAG TPA: hypothetical protein PKC24_05075 [Cyclobacteriaceae bacterium]|nr:hypothetical protein [Cyclobacteriaceae bacterium]